MKAFFNRKSKEKTSILKKDTRKIITLDFKLGTATVVFIQDKTLVLNSPHIDRAFTFKIENPREWRVGDKVLIKYAEDVWDNDPDNIIAFSIYIEERMERKR